jgi:hypothetical protein
MTGTNCDLFTHKSSRSYLNHLVYVRVLRISGQTAIISLYLTGFCNSKETTFTARYELNCIIDVHKKSQFRKRTFMVMSLTWTRNQDCLMG